MAGGVDGSAGDDVSLIFVYGTLKRGFYNHALIDDLIRTGGAAYSGPCTTVEAFPLVCGPHGIPYLINLPGSGRRVRGELYSVSSVQGLPRLDELRAWSEATTRDCRWSWRRKTAEIECWMWRRILRTGDLGRSCGRGVARWGWVSIVWSWGRSM